MAIFYKHIKGIAEGATDTSHQTAIIFASEDKPSIKHGENNHIVDYGKIITTKGTNTIEKVTIDNAIITNLHPQDQNEPIYSYSDPDLIINYPTIFNEAVKSNKSISAQYFNATSDRRAKDNINPLNIKAIDIIKNTPLYTFNYKDLNTPSIGIMAQDIKDIKINDFGFVINENASGENGDYMTLRESKLIYLLWKAIQEQQAEIEELKNKLRD